MSLTISPKYIGSSKRSEKKPTNQILSYLITILILIIET